MKKKVLEMAALLLVLIVTSASADVVSVDEARNIAREFVKNSNQAKGLRGVSARVNEELPLPIVLAKGGDAALYVFNRPEGGYIIVSAEGDTRRQILAWNDEGYYDPANVPAPMQDILDSYIVGINRLRHATPAERALMEKANEEVVKAPARRRVEGDLPTSVAPLLGEIAWGQDDPYNRMTPTYLYEDGNTYHYVTGCVATAIAQVMMYHRWPERGRGSNSYQWQGQTLSADFSQSVYRWDLMLPYYEITNWSTMEVNYNDEQANAVALLMHDVGISVNMWYDYSGSSANFTGSRMVEFFDYDKNIRTVYGDNCSTEDWENELRQELAAARPVLCSGGSTAGGHEFVCDGYNADGLFHYNFGWGLRSSGWYASTATGFDASPSISMGLEKNHGGTGALSLHSSEDFVWKQDNILNGSLSLFCAGLDGNTSTVTIETALALRNVQTGEVKYYPQRSEKNFSVWVGSMSLDETVPDGTYQVYPVGRLSGEEWQMFYHNPLRQIMVDLTVAGGVKTWTNNIPDPISEGVVAVDDIYYILDDNDNTATVTRRNERGNSYKGDVVIPDAFTYEGRTYRVVTIGERAFEDCAELLSVVVGKNVTLIGFGAFGSANLVTLTFAEGSQLQSIGGWAFNNCGRLSGCVLPEGLVQIDMCAFQGCIGMRSITIPSSVTYIASNAFNGFTGMQAIYVKWTSMNDFYISDEAFAGVDVSQITLYVPKGCVNLYRSTSPWSDFDIQEDAGEGDSVEWHYDPATATLTITGSGRILWSNTDAPWSQYTNDIRHLVIGDGIKTIPSELFSYMYLETVKLPEGLTSIGEMAFYYCEQLSSINFPASLTSIGKYAFFYTVSLTSINLPANLEKINSRAFGYCYGLATIRCHALTPPSLGYYNDAFQDISSTGRLIVSKGSDYSAWKDYLPSGWTIIYTDDVDGEGGSDEWSWTFDQATGTLSVEGYGDMPYDSRGEWKDIAKQVHHVVLGEGVSGTPNLCFWGFDSIESISMPSTIRTLKYGTFYACTMLKKIECLALTAPDISEGDVFAYLPTGGTLIVPEGADYSSWLAVLPSDWSVEGSSGGDTPVWSWTFDETTGTLTVTGSGDMTYSSFGGEWQSIANGVLHAVIGEGVTSLPNYCFFGCNHLESVSLPQTLTTIGVAAFYACRYLTKIECLATKAPDVSAPDVFGYLPNDGLLYVPKGADYSSWLAVLPSGWSIAGGDDDPLIGTMLYVLGNDGSWNPSQPSATLSYRAADKVYAGDINVSNLGDGYGYFCIGTTLGADSSDWGTFNANRLGAPVDDYLLTGAIMCGYVEGRDASFKAEFGSHHLVVDLNARIIAFDCEDGIHPMLEDGENSVVYDLFGRRATQLQPGTIYLKNGHKFITK